MDWMRQIDGYCERMGPGLGAEPVNALTNAAFLAVALWLWSASRGVERVLCILLAAIAAGSALLHTRATIWSALADTLPIAAFTLVYVHAANRRFLGLGGPAALAATLGAAVGIALAGRAFASVPGFAVSAAYWPLPLLILAYAAALRRRDRALSVRLAAAAGVLSVSILLRSVDLPLCHLVPMGTHFAWHLLNAVMLGFMVTLLRWHRLEPAGARG